jgi:hypothetical protein
MRLLRTRPPAVRPVASAVALAALCALSGCSDSAAPSAPSAARSAPAPAPEAAPASAPAPTAKPDAAVDAYRLDLLRTAAKVAAAVPTKPHQKTRGRLQESVVEAQLALDRPAEAFAVASTIADWRRGVATASVALRHAARGETARARQLATIARRAGEDLVVGGEETQAWRTDRVRAGVARVFFALGDAEAAAAAAEGLAPSEELRVVADRPETTSPARLDSQLAEAAVAAKNGLVEQVNHAVLTLLAQYEARFADEIARGRIEEGLRACWNKLPTLMRLDTGERAIRFVAGRGDLARARVLLGELRAAVDAERWTPEQQVPVRGRLAALRHAVGETDDARRELAAAVRLFADTRTRIVDIFRGEALRPLAEAHLDAGDPAGALAVYRTALEEAVVNPNSRPRAEDLCALCCSMAVRGCAPDAEFLARLNAVVAALGDPW